MACIAEEQLYEKRINFYRERMQTCGYRFFDMIQIRTKEMAKLAQNYDNEGTQQQVEDKVLGGVNTYINCLEGDHKSKDIPDYIQG